MPKRSIFIRPPFPLPGFADAVWRDLQLELGGIRDKGFTEAQIWKLATLAEHQGQFKRGKLNADMTAYLKRARAEFGLPELPPA